MMSFTEFLDLVKTYKMLYGREIAEKLLVNNINKFYNLDNASLILKEMDK